MAGWQGLYLIEAAPSFLLGFLVLAYLTVQPEDAHWLDAQERTLLAITGFMVAAGLLTLVLSSSGAGARIKHSPAE
ncbi:hypothetical protein [Methylobacterium nigriterrae]|uniref:hypothetical protein n=1 Tax=Methylobacterium nigriterrae TaxID=3127512 RepID=UPI003013F7D4